MSAATTPTEKAFEVIELLTKKRFVRFSDLVDEVGMSRTAAHRLLANLEQGRFLQRGGQGFEIGPRMHHLSAALVGTVLSGGSMQRILSELSKVTGESCGLAILKGGEVEYVQCYVSGARLTSAFQPGQRGPLHCTSSGRIFLASMSKPNLEHFYASSPWTRFTANTVCEARMLRPIVEATRRQGYAVTGSEFTVGLVGGAVSVMSPQGALLGCLNIFAPAVRLSESDVHGLIPLLKLTSYKITQALEITEKKAAICKQWPRT